MRRVFWLCLPCLVLSLVLTASARNGNDFAGSYQIGNVSDDGETVHLTLTVKIFNYGDKDVRNGAVALLDNQPRPGLLGSFGVIRLFRLGQQVTLSQQFDVSETEYRRWMDGGQPNLKFLSNDSGYARLRDIHLRYEHAPTGRADQ
jgi:hypothetical protein